MTKIPFLEVRKNVPLKDHTRFAVGGPADLFVETAHLESFIQAVELSIMSGLACCLIGEGTNLIVSDHGFHGIVLRWTARTIKLRGRRVEADAGAALLELVNTTVAAGLQGLETLAGVPGSVGAAIYGNAGAYGHSISERIVLVNLLDNGALRRIENQECQFRYRESIFKQRKSWFILSAELMLERGSATELRRTADDIVYERNRKFPPEMKCAGSVFKNLLAADVPPDVLSQVPPPAIREGKIAAGWFLEQVGAKGMRQGGICVAGHHANLIYNAGEGTASDLRDLISKLKRLVQERYRINLEEEVQYLGHF